jgi:opacity protein-like surface antigen
MRKVPFLLGLFLLLTLPALAQERPSAPAFEVYAGYALGHLNAGANASNNEHHNINGWDAQAMAHVNPWMALVIDYSGYTGTPNVAGGPVDWRIHSLMAGPQLTWRRNSRITPFAHALFGATRLNAFVGTDSLVETNFSMALGGGVDFWATKHFSVRAGQFDYYMTRFPNVDFSTGTGIASPDRQNSWRFSSGLLFRFGKRD